MTKRVFISAGKFRASKPGYNAETAAERNLIFHENMEALVPFESGVSTVSAGSTLSVALTKTYSTPPFVIIRCSQNYLPGNFTFYASFNAGNNSIKLYNKMSQSLTIGWFVFRELT